MSYGASGKQTLVYVRHYPVTSSRLINPKSLKTYLSWWDNTFVPLLERSQFALLGVSFIVKKPAKFQNLILKTERIEDMHLKHTVFRLLDEMEKLAYRDILDFFKTHNIHLPVKNRDQIIARLLDKPKGIMKILSHNYKFLWNNPLILKMTRNKQSQQAQMIMITDTQF